MKGVLVLYATREGQTRRIAEYLAERIEAKGVMADVVDAASLPPQFSLERYSSAVLAASVHLGVHEREMIKFVKRFLDELRRIPAVFLSVSLSEAGAENSTASSDRRARASGDVDWMIKRFLKETGWNPEKVQPVAGALLYTKYNFFVRFLMKQIARKNGSSTDASRDHVFTNWQVLDRLAEEIAAPLLAETPKVAIC